MAASVTYLSRPGEYDGPHAGFIIGPAHCGALGPEHHLMCLAPVGHEGEHQWRDYRGCRMRFPGSSRTIPFCGFAS